MVVPMALRQQQSRALLQTILKKPGLISRMISSSASLRGPHDHEHTPDKATAYDHPDPFWWGPEHAAGREWVGNGVNSNPCYQDRHDFPYPAVRWRKDDDIILPIKKKELGDWKNLSMDEKKLLYRYSFCKTFTEYGAYNGHWKLTGALILWQLNALIMMIFLWDEYIAGPFPPTHWDKVKEIQLWYMIETNHDPVKGVSTYWDYEKKRWIK